MASRTAEYYRKNPAARKRRLEQQKRYQKKPSQVKKRVELNRINRQKGRKGDGKDVSHTTDGKTVLESASKNRARNRGKLKVKR